MCLRVTVVGAERCKQRPCLSPLLQLLVLVVSLRLPPLLHWVLL